MVRTWCGFTVEFRLQSFEYRTILRDTKDCAIKDGGDELSINVREVYFMDNPQRILRLPDVRERVLLSKPVIYRMISKGQFPRPIKLTSRAVAWRVSDIDNWIASRQAA